MYKQVLLVAALSLPLAGCVAGGAVPYVPEACRQVVDVGFEIVVRPFAAGECIVDTAEQLPQIGQGLPGGRVQPGTGGVTTIIPPGLGIQAQNLFSPWNGYVEVPNQLSPGFTTSLAPALAVGQDRLFLAVTGGTGEVFVNTFDGQSWSGFGPVPGGSTSVAPTIVFYRDRLYLAVRGDDGRVYINSWAGDWAGYQPLDGYTSDAPALAVHDDRLYLAVRGTDNRFYLNSSDGFFWSGFQPDDDGLIVAAPALTSSAGRLDVAVSGLGDIPFHGFFAGPGSGVAWAPVSGNQPGASAPALAGTSGLLHLAVRGDQNLVYVSWSSGNGWSPYSAVPGGATDAAPALVEYQGRLFLAVKGLDNRVYINWLNQPLWFSPPSIELPSIDVPTIDIPPFSIPGIEGTFDPPPIDIPLLGLPPSDEP